MLYIFGYGGFAREVRAFLKKIYLKEGVEFVVDDPYYREDFNAPVIPYSKFTEYWDRHNDQITVAVGDPGDRWGIVRKLFEEQGFVNYNSFPNLFLRKSGKGQPYETSGDIGNIFCPGSVITTNIHIGSHNHFNLNTTIGHDCVVGSFNTFSPGVNISGNVVIGNNCYFGTNSSVRQGVNICDNVTIGMGAVVLNDITVPGTYVGIPCKKLTK